MAELLKPALLPIFKDNINADAPLTTPIVLQITKFRDGAHVSMRLSDGENSVAAVLPGGLPKDFAAPLRLVRVLEYVPCEMKDKGFKPYLQIRNWEDAAPCSEPLGNPQMMRSLREPAGDAANGAAVNPSEHSTQKTNGINGSANSTGSTGSGRPTHTTDGSPIVTIESLSPYQSSWTLLVRATVKNDVREYTSKKSDTNGRLFSVVFTDETGDIKATGFNNAVDSYYDKIVEGQQYYISKMLVQAADKRFNTTGHDFELVFNRDTVVEVSMDGDKSLPSLFYKFVPSLSELGTRELDTTVDVIGVLAEIGETETITAKSSGIPYTKRELQLVDDSEFRIPLTLWGDVARDFSDEVGSVVAVKGARLTDFRGRQLSTTRTSRVVSNPDTKDAHRLKGWYQASGLPSSFERVQGSEAAEASEKPSAQIVPVKRIHDEMIGHRTDGKADFITTVARVSQVYQRTVAYPSCSLGDCRKKVVDQGDGWRCEKCDATMAEPRWRFLLTMLLFDVSDEENGLQVNVFDEIGRQLFGDTAKEIHELHEQAGSGFSRELANELNKIQGKMFEWRLKANQDSWNGVERTRFTVMNVKEPEPIAAGSQLLAELGY